MKKIPCNRVKRYDLTENLIKISEKFLQVQIKNPVNFLCKFLLVYKFSSDSIFLHDESIILLILNLIHVSKPEIDKFVQLLM